MSLVGEFIQNNLRSNISYIAIENIQQQCSAIDDLLRYLSRLREFDKIEIIENKIKAIDSYLMLKQDIITYMQCCNQQSFMSWAYDNFKRKGLAIEIVKSEHINFKRMLMNKTKEIFIMGSNRNEQMELKDYRKVLIQMRTARSNISHKNLCQSDQLSQKFQAHMQNLHKKVQQFDASVDNIVRKVLQYQKQIKSSLIDILQINQHASHEQFYNRQQDQEKIGGKNINQTQQAFHQDSKCYPEIKREPQTPIMEIQRKTQQDCGFFDSRIYLQDQSPNKYFSGHSRQIQTQDNFSIDNYHKQRGFPESFIPTKDIAARNYYY